MDMVISFVAKINDALFLICCLPSVWLVPVAFLFAFYCILCLFFLLSSFNKISKIVHAHWLVERSVCMRVWKHGCDVKMFCAHHASTNLKMFLTRKLGKFTLCTHSLVGWNWENLYKTCRVNFFFALADILREKNPYFRNLLFCKTKTDYAHKTSCTRLRDSIKAIENFFFLYLQSLI